MAGATVTVAWPPLKTFVANAFLFIMKVTVPFGTPPPGASGSTSAVSLSELILFLFDSEYGASRTSVSAGETDSEELPD